MTLWGKERSCYEKEQDSNLGEIGNIEIKEKKKYEFYPQYVFKKKSRV